MRSAQTSEDLQDQPACIRPGVAAPGRTQQRGRVRLLDFWDIAGAKSFGFWTCWVNRSKLPAEELRIMPDVTVPTLNGLVDAVEELTANRE